MQLRPYQEKAVNSIRDAFRTHNRAPLLVLPTGGGKTICFSYIAANASARGNRVLILVHRIELIRQTSEKLMQFGIRHGIINDKFTPDLTAPVQVASVQTLVRRLQKYPDAWFQFALIIVDEAHHAVGGNTWGKIIDRCPQALVLGVTATPCRGDGTGLGKNAGGWFDSIVFGPSTAELIRLGHLVKPVVYAPATKLDLTGLKTRAGDYEKGELAERVDKPAITGSAVSHYMKICPGTPAVVFCVSVLHAQHVAAEFRSAGFRAYAVDGGMEDDLRKRILSGLGNGTVDVVASCDLISEGTDIPAIGAAILLRPTKSLGLYIQQVGRALRPSAGKDRAVILDHVGNVIQHGLPEEDRDWTLDGEARKEKKKDEEKAVNIKCCPSCYAVHEPAPTCPVCGFLYIPDKKEIAQEDGELREITEADKVAIRKKQRVEVAKARSLDDLKRIEKERNYKPGWAVHVFNSRKNVNLPPRQ